MLSEVLSHLFDRIGEKYRVRFEPYMPPGDGRVSSVDYVSACFDRCFEAYRSSPHLFDPPTRPIVAPDGSQGFATRTGAGEMLHGTPSHDGLYLRRL